MPNGPDGEPISLFESGAILLYLAERPAISFRETRVAGIASWNGRCFEWAVSAQCWVRRIISDTMQKSAICIPSIAIRKESARL